MSQPITYCMLQIPATFVHLRKQSPPGDYLLFFCGRSKEVYLLFIQVLKMLGTFHFFHIVVPLHAWTNRGARFPFEGLRHVLDHLLEFGNSLSNILVILGSE